MSRKLAVALSIAAVIALAALAYWRSTRPEGEESAPATDITEPELETPVAAGEAVLYFPGRYDRLYAERRDLEVELEGQDKIRLVVRELLKGPTTEDLSPVLPPDLEVGSVFLDTDGTVFLNLSSKVGTLTGLGSTAEMLAVFSLVNTVLSNEPAARSVVLLWNGRQLPSLAGHVDTTRPLSANRRLIAESS